MTKKEVWVAAYCAMLSAYSKKGYTLVECTKYAIKGANRAVEAFQERFPEPGYRDQKID